MKVLVAVFILLYAFLAVVLLAFSVHGPDVLPVFAGAYLVISVSVLLITYLQLEKKGTKRKPAIVVVLGIALALCSGLVLAGAAAYEELERDLQLARTQVSDVRDETLYTADGNPIGIRVSYAIRFPHDGYYEVSPFMRPDEGFHRAVRDQIRARSYSDRPLQMRAAARTIEPYPVEANQGRIDAAHWHSLGSGFGSRAAWSISSRSSCWRITSGGRKMAATVSLGRKTYVGTVRRRATKL